MRRAQPPRPAGRLRPRRRPWHRLRAASYRFVERRLIDLGFRVRRNDPYAGGYITRHYGRPREQVHALQIEVARDLYMDEARFERSAAFPEVQDNLTPLIEALANELSRLDGP